MLGRLVDSVLRRGLLPDVALRSIVRSRVKELEASFDQLGTDEYAALQADLLARLEADPITVAADEANRQHYDLPPEFFATVLGPWLKYSCCSWSEETTSLAGAEEAMLALTAERAGLRDGQTILDLGCGWGSLVLWAAERYPESRLLAVSNSHSQRRYIDGQVRRRGLRNVRVVTADVSDFDPRERFDRIVSVEMLEHVRNHGALFKRVSDWLQPEGRLFVHVFCHRRHLYLFEVDGAGSWMAEHFFRGGIMPSWDYLLGYQDDLTLLERWEVGGTHYAKTLLAWLNNLDLRRNLVMPVLENTYGRDHAGLWLLYWRLFSWRAQRPLLSRAAAPIS